MRDIYGRESDRRYLLDQLGEIYIFTSRRTVRTAALPDSIAPCDICPWIVSVARCKVATLCCCFRLNEGSCKVLYMLLTEYLVPGTEEALNKLIFYVSNTRLRECFMSCLRTSFVCSLALILLLLDNVDR